MHPGIPVTDPRVRARLERDGAIQGWVTVYDFEGPAQTMVKKLVPWWDDPIWRNRDTGAIGWNPEYRPGRAFRAPPGVAERIEERKTPVTRTSAEKKFEALKKLLTNEARKFTTPDGVTTWPASVAAELKEAAWKQGKAGVLTTEEQVELLARTYVVFGANKQKEADQKHITTTWHGHTAA